MIIGTDNECQPFVAREAGKFTLSRDKSLTYLLQIYTFILICTNKRILKTLN